MSRPTLRFFVFVVLALLGAPMAMHVVMHDLHGHHHEEAAMDADHGDHEHPVVASPAPRLPDATRVVLPVAVVPAATAATWTSVATTGPNVLSFGAWRLDDDVGLQPLLSTFLI